MSSLGSYSTRTEQPETDPDSEVRRAERCPGVSPAHWRQRSVITPSHVDIRETHYSRYKQFSLPQSGIQGQSLHHASV